MHPGRVLHHSSSTSTGLIVGIVVIVVLACCCCGVCVHKHRSSQFVEIDSERSPVYSEGGRKVEEVILHQEMQTQQKVSVEHTVPGYMVLAGDPNAHVVV